MDLRWRIVYQRIAMSLTFKTISRNLNIAPSTAHRVYNQFESTNSVEPLLQRRRPDVRVLSSHTEIHVIGLILENPSMYLHELTSEIKKIFNIRVHPSTICRLFKSYGFTRKKIRQVALQRCYKLRGAFMSQCFMFHPDMFVFVDETGSDHRSHIRKYGYALRGVTPETSRPLVRGKRINTISAICTKGLVAVEHTTGTVTGESFYDFIRGSLIPNMLPFDGCNAKSILVMDNASVHHVVEVTELLRQSGILLLFLPPYSPDLNPAEESYSYVKSYLKKHDSLLQVMSDITDLVNSAFSSITQQMCINWITHAGYIQSCALTV